MVNGFTHGHALVGTGSGNRQLVDSAEQAKGRDLGLGGSVLLLRRRRTS